MALFPWYQTCWTILTWTSSYQAQNGWNSERPGWLGLVSEWPDFLVLNSEQPDMLGLIVETLRHKVSKVERSCTMMGGTFGSDENGCGVVSPANGFSAHIGSGHSAYCCPA